MNFEKKLYEDLVEGVNKEREIQLKLIDLNSLYDPTKVITSHKPLTKDKTFAEDGVFSPSIFGENSDNENLEYQCTCGAIKGKFMLGSICQDCETEVKYTEPILDRLGWIHLGDYEIINPIMYFFLSRLAGTKKLNSIIGYNVVLDSDGNVVRDEDDIANFKNIGLVEFKDRFDEIFDKLYSQSNRKDKKEIKKVITMYKDYIFINAIPVFSTVLRPASKIFIDRPIFKFDEINNSYNFIIKISNMINCDKNEGFDINILPNLYTLQIKANMIFDKIIENLSGKEGFIRDKTLANRVNFSARNVITPLPPGYKIDDVVLPYLTFLELYSKHIINILTKVKKISPNEANYILEIAKTKFSQEIYDICQELITKTTGKCKILLNRNPSISYGSFMCLNVAGIKKDYTDLTTSISNTILQPLGGDYDGDVLNIIAIFENKYKRKFSEVFSPKNMFISRNDGYFNKELSLDRDQILGIHLFCN